MAWMIVTLVVLMIYDCVDPVKGQFNFLQPATGPDAVCVGSDVTINCRVQFTDGNGVTTDRSAVWSINGMVITNNNTPNHMLVLSSGLTVGLRITNVSLELNSRVYTCASTDGSITSRYTLNVADPPTLNPSTIMMDPCLNDVVISWDAAMSNSLCGSVSYNVILMTESGMVINSAVTMNTRLNFTGLNESTAYVVTLFAMNTNSSGDSVNVTVRTVTSSTTLPSVEIDFRDVCINDCIVVLNLTPPTTTGCGDTYSTSVTEMHGNVAKIDDTTFNISVASGITSHNVVAVISNRGDNATVERNLTLPMLNEAIPQNVTNIRLNSTDTTITAKWDAVVGEYCGPICYNLILTNDVNSDIVPVPIITNGTAHTFTSLKPGINYMVSIAAMNRAASSGFVSESVETNRQTGDEDDPFPWWIIIIIIIIIIVVCGGLIVILFLYQKKKRKGTVHNTGAILMESARDPPGATGPDTEKIPKNEYTELPIGIGTGHSGESETLAATSVTSTAEVKPDISMQEEKQESIDDNKDLTDATASKKPELGSETLQSDKSKHVVETKTDANGTGKAPPLPPRDPEASETVQNEPNGGGANTNAQRAEKPSPPLQPRDGTSDQKGTGHSGESEALAVPLVTPTTKDETGIAVQKENKESVDDNKDSTDATASKKPVLNYADLQEISAHRPVHFSTVQPTTGNYVQIPPQTTHRKRDESTEL